MKTQILTLFLIASPLFTFAQNSQEDLFSLPLSSLMDLKITGSTLTDEDLLSVPASVSVYTQKDLSNLGLDSLDELLNFIPGFQSYRSSSNSVNFPFSARGRSIGNIGAEILVLLDGQRLNDPRTGGSILLIPKYPLQYIQRVEFIRGPGSAVYGSNAMMGIINIISIENKDKLQLGVGSNRLWKTLAMNSTKIGDYVFNIQTHLQADSGQDYYMQDGFGSSYSDTKDPRKIQDAIISLKKDKFELQLTHFQTMVERFYVSSHVSESFNERKARFNSISSKYKFNWLKFNSHISLAYSETFSQTFGQLTAGAPSSTPVSVEPVYASPIFDGQGESRILWHNSIDYEDKSNFQFGLEYRFINSPQAIAESNYNLEQLSNKDFPVAYYGSLVPNTAVQSASTRNISAIYAQYKKDFDHAIHLTSGLRYDNYSNIGSQLSPRIGLVHKLNDTNSLKFLYGLAFRAPSESELNLINNPFLLGNKNLEPETVESFDLIWVKQLNHSSLSFGYFENHFKKSIVQASTSSSLLQYENQDQAPIKGVELEYYKKFNETWSSRISFTQITEKPDLNFKETAHLSSIGINYLRNKLNMNLSAVHHGKRDTPASSGSTRNSLKSYTQVFTKIKYSHTKNLKSILQIKNLTNDQYYTPSSSSSINDGVPNRKMEVLASIEWDY